MTIAGSNCLISKIDNGEIDCVLVRNDTVSQMVQAETVVVLIAGKGYAGTATNLVALPTIFRGFEVGPWNNWAQIYLMK